MKVCLVSAPTSTDYTRPEHLAIPGVRIYNTEPPVGILTLAAELESSGLSPKIVNTNRLYYKFLVDECRPASEFCGYAAAVVQTGGWDVIGFSTICNSYPLTLRIAAEVKRALPNTTIVLGGPQASVVDVATLQAFPFVDFVLRGEADHSLPQLLEALSSDADASRIRGLTHRAGRRVVRNPDATVIEDMDSLPLPAFHLDGNLVDADNAVIEVGRGCPFACTFCSTNNFFRRRFRLKSPAKILDEMRFIAKTFNHRTFDLTHDLFTVDRRKIIEFCHVMKSSGENFQWSCSARTDCIDDGLIALMADAGCVGLFYGVETGSERMQKIIDKHLNLDHCWRMVESAERHKVATTVSLIMGYPEETLADLRQSLDFFVSSLSVTGATPTLGVLAPLAGTPIFNQYFDQLSLFGICANVSHQGRIDDPIEDLLIRANPDIFPNFYLLPSAHLEQPLLLELEVFASTVRKRFRWLIVALHHAATGGILEVFLQWQTHRQQLHPDVQILNLRSYYSELGFARDFRAFVRERNRVYPDDRVIALCDCEDKIMKTDLPVQDAFDRITAVADANTEGLPVIAPGVRIFRLEWDIPAVLRSFRKRDDSQQIRKESWYVSSSTSGNLLDLTRVPEAFADLLAWCDGKRTERDLCAQFRDVHGDWNGADGTQTCLALISMFHEKGMLRTALTADRQLPIQSGGVSIPAYAFSSASES